MKASEKVKRITQAIIETERGLVRAIANRNRYSFEFISKEDIDRVVFYTNHLAKLNRMQAA